MWYYDASYSPPYDDCRTSATHLLLSDCDEKRTSVDKYNNQYNTTL